MAWYSFIFDLFGYIWKLLLDWLSTIFIVPFKSTDMLWLLVPIWIGWAFAEFFQEKRGTSMGNAVSNSVIILWGSIDCARQTTYYIAKHPFMHTSEILLRFFLIALIFAYGAMIIWLGLKANPLIKYLGRIREITYVFVMFVPIFYGAIKLSFNHVFAAILFFPIFYYVIELIDYLVPDSKLLKEDEDASKQIVASVPNHETYLPRQNLNQNQNSYPSYQNQQNRSSFNDQNSSNINQRRF